jgi:hypothetical protein
MRLRFPASALVTLAACEGRTCTLQSPIVLSEPDAGATSAATADPTPASATETRAAPIAPPPPLATEHTSFGGGFPGGEPLVVRAEDLPGGPHAVDPLALLSKAREVAGVGDDVGLKALVAVHVGSSGLVDLAPTNYEAHIEYWFMKKAALPDAGAAPPIGATNPSQTPRATEWIVHVVATGMHAPAHQNTGGDIGGTLPPPHCSLSRLWDAALRAGAPKGAVAVLTYGNKGGIFGGGDTGKGWLFAIEGREPQWNMSDKTCEIESAAGAGSKF